MIREGLAQLGTEAQTRTTFLAAAAEAFPRAFSPMSIKLAFRKSGIYPPNAEQQLANPCVAGLPQSAPAPKRTNVDISTEMLDDVSVIPTRRAKTLEGRRAKSAVTRAQRLITTTAPAAETATSAAGTMSAKQTVAIPDLPSLAANVIVTDPALSQQAAAALAMIKTKDPTLAMTAAASPLLPDDITDIAENFACDDLEIMEYAQSKGILQTILQKH